MPTSDENDSLNQEKQRLRAWARGAREQLTAEDRAGKDAALCQLLASLAPRQPIVALAGYRAHRAEANVDRFLETLLYKGIPVYFPRQGPARSLNLCRVKNLQVGWASGPFGVCEPVGEAEDDFSMIGCILVPGIVFDRDGNRLGFGMGFYDRLLQRMGRRVVRVGVAYACQIAPAVPVTTTDEGMDFVVTEDQVYRCKRQKVARQRIR